VCKIFYFISALPAQFLNQLLKLSIIPRNENTSIGDFDRTTKINLVNRQYWLVNLLFENYKRTPEDFVVTQDENFYFEINYYFYALILFLQQTKVVLDLCNCPIDYIKVLFLLYFNQYVFEDSLNI
jgi:hypothetical protein